ncbi:NADP-dependent 3-hydroxy acid dehydrogenase YdfG [Motilibacter peucedani]|uniref:NADP-dependent 3-hydroxy acid dehydrogenase YdfG n=1 Tax=Motilibacter peucedani TaxID=598650 RepID=A0A420XN98_9ACTN|nr:SDR family oxidoreductase [Motilibacter peucedani]RKS72743.1 NADP-dependent 3-hydroxy acid dehydrogenase YdfG [Motilibacter peucedani]
MSGRTVLVTGASSGFGALTVRALGAAGHTVFGGMRGLEGRNTDAARALAQHAQASGSDVHAVELDVSDQRSVDAALESILSTGARLDVVVHNAGHMVLGPAEAFTPEQLAEVYDVNVLGTQRVNRAVLPHLRAQRSGLLVWVGSSSTRGGHPPFLAPYFAAKAAMDALAESYAAELARFGIDTTIVVPGAFPCGTNHFAHAGRPVDTEREAAYDEAYGELRRGLPARLASLVPSGSDVQSVADEIVRIVQLPRAERPFRTHVDPSRDSSEVVSVVADRIRHEFYHRAGIEDLLSPNDAL